MAKEHLPTDMFEHERATEEARRARKIERLYHVGQAKAWDGRDVLAELMDKHGGIKVPSPQREALGRVFTTLMWGELAAWKISAQLADRFVPIEAKLAATSQAHDEARHFYVMHDYLEALGVEPTPLDSWTRRFLELTLQTDDLARKMAGMQIQIESIALTLFQLVRKLEICPVLSELLVYYERDEARHVGLGTQHLPTLINEMNAAEQASFAAFQLRLLGNALAAEKVMEEDLAVLGVSARQLIVQGTRKQLPVLDEIARNLGRERHDRMWSLRVFDVMAESVFPEGKIRGRRRRARQLFEVVTGRRAGITAEVLDGRRPSFSQMVEQPS